MSVLRFTLVLLFAVMTYAQTTPPAGGVRITMERRGTGMDLSVQQYKLILEGDGSVLFEGKSLVRGIAIHKYWIKPTTVRQLGDKFEAIGYFDFQKNLGSCEDAAAVVTSVTTAGKSNEVTDWGCGTNPALNQLEDEIDRVSNSKVWIKGRTRLSLHWPRN